MFLLTYTRELRFCIKIINQPHTHNNYTHHCIPIYISSLSDKKSKPQTFRTILPPAPLETSISAKQQNPLILTSKSPFQESRFLPCSHRHPRLRP